MPIKDKSVYPADWKQISLDARKRAGNRCEGCGLHNYSIGWREKDGTFVRYERTWDAIPEEEIGSEINLADGSKTKVFQIILTVAHLDHNPGNNDPSNLRAYCQKCHNAYDAPMRAKHAAETRKRKQVPA
jgi:hypothetical protein